MYFKITNKDSEVYKELHEMRTEEIRIEAANRKAITEKTGLEWKAYLGHAGQQNFNRVCQFDGFQFLEPDKVDPKVWRRHNKYQEIFVPNKHTAQGKAITHFLLNVLGASSFINVYKALDLKLPHGKFLFPYVEITGEVIILMIDNKSKVDHPDLIEITMKEFNELNENN